MQTKLTFKVTNNTTTETMSNIMFKLNHNWFGIDIVDQSQGQPQGVSVGPGQVVDLTAMCVSGKNVGGNTPDRPPILVQTGFMSSLDKVYFEIPVLL
jgi:hypothetical protein